MTRTASATPVPSGGGYTAPETLYERIRAKGTPPSVDRNGRVIASVAKPSVAAPTQPSPMVETIVSIASVHGVDVAALLDSEAFVSSVVELEPTDTEGVTNLVRDAVVRNPRIALNALTMRPNPAQGGSSVPLMTPQTLRDRVRAAIAKTPAVDEQGHIIGRII